jgi:hypothetical protein
MKFEDNKTTTIYNIKLKNLLVIVAWQTNSEMSLTHTHTHTHAHTHARAREGPTESHEQQFFVK